MKIFDVKDYGAIANGKVLSTAAIQKAIDDCAFAGGGQVLFSQGTFMSGTITLRSNVELHIEEGAVLLGSPDWRDYPEQTSLTHVIAQNLPRRQSASFIFAECCENISIKGNGVIDANGASFIEKTPQGKYKRINAPTPPRVVFFAGCKNINIEDITMINQPAGWSYWIHDCDLVSFFNCKLFAELHYPNNDGIHINSSRDVTIRNCVIRTGDDSIVIRANNRSLNENKVCERVNVSDCELTSYANGVRIGWVNDGVIRNCTLKNLNITDSNVGIGLSLPRLSDDMTDYGREPTRVENLSFENIKMDEMYANPIMLRINNEQTTLCDSISNLSFKNITARALEFPIILGRPQNPISDITFTDCSFEKVDDTVYPNYESHGYAKALRCIDAQIVENGENISFLNTRFSCKKSRSL